MSETSSGASNAQLRILLVEDDEEWQMLLKRHIEAALKQIGHSRNIRVVSTATEALNLLDEAYHWDLLVTDIALPSTDTKLGMELVVAARDRSIPCVVVSLVLDAADVETIIRQYKAQAFFDKRKFDPDRFKTEVTKTLQSSNSLEASPPVEPPLRPGSRPTLTSRFLVVARNTPVLPKRVFVLMPFGEPWSTKLWQERLRPICEALGLEAKRADELYGQVIMEDIWSGICAARIIIADITGRNPNVLYELGIAHAIGKECVLLTQNEKDIPFDLRTYRHIIYAENCEYQELMSEIKRSIDTILSKDTSHD